MKKLTTILACVFVLALAVPVLAQEEEATSPFLGGLTSMEYDFNHFVQDLAAGSTTEKFDDDLDTTFTGSIGEISVWFDLEISDGTAGGDKAPQGSWSDVVGGYGGKWTPEAMADSEFFLQVGDVGTGFGKNVNNDDSPWGSIEAGWKMGEVSVTLGYGRVGEWNTDDDVQGDSHLARGQVKVPLGESGFTVGAYLAMYAASDAVLREATDPSITDIQLVDPVASTYEITYALPVSEVLGDRSAFLGSLHLSGNAGGASVFAETGFAAGTEDYVAENAAVERDLSGFYALGGADFTVGQMTVGIEAGFGTGDDTGTSDENEGFLGFNNDFGFDEIIEDELASDGLSNKIYGKLKASLSPSEKISLDAAVSYVAPVEDVEGANGTVDTYGFEFNGTMKYKLADNLTYKIMGAVASLEEDWQGESSAFQFQNALTFSF